MCLGSKVLVLDCSALVTCIEDSVIQFSCNSPRVGLFIPRRCLAVVHMYILIYILKGKYTRFWVCWARALRALCTGMMIFMWFHIWDGYLDHWIYTMFCKPVPWEGYVCGRVFDYEISLLYDIIWISDLQHISSIKIYLYKGFQLHGWYY